MDALTRREFLGSTAALAALPLAATAASATGEGAPAMTAITPFTIAIDTAQLADLKERLTMTRWPSEVPGTGWERGAPVAYARALVETWRDRYDWRETAARLNGLPQFVTEIDGQPIHFIHVKSPRAGAPPLLMVHGWPGSPLEFESLVAPLGTDFDLVIPTIPGFGFSGPIRGGGWSAGRVGKALAALMAALGYERFGIHGGDMGAIVAREMALGFPERIAGAHVLQFFSFPSGDPAEFAMLTEDDHRRLGRLELFGQRDSYNQVMGKRPQSIAFALSDSPAGLLAWMLELFATFGDHPHQLSDVQILDQATLYWLTGTIGSSANIYFETARSGAWENTAQTTVPMGVAVFANDFLSIRTFAERDHSRIVHWSEFDRGGHFAALEVPDLLAADIRAFFTTVGELPS